MSVDHGDRTRGRTLLDRIESERQDAETAFARWRFLASGEDTEAALQAITEDADRFPRDPDLQRALGWTLGECGRSAEAVAPLLRAVKIDIDFADAWHDLALAHEAIGDFDGMQKAFAKVYALDTADDQPPTRFEPEQVLKWANHAIAALPPSVQNVIPPLPIFVQDYPDDWIIDESPFDPRLLGLFDGPTYAEVHGSDTGGVAAHIYLYQRNLERVCPGPREMAEQVRITLHHEVGHFLGLDEAELHDRGLG
jgi:predicted Zn-dependent protease with MMP-like domain